MQKKQKNKSGVTLIALTVTVVILLIITGTIVYNSKNNISIKKVDNFYSDIETIQYKVNMYYLNYGEIPILYKYSNQEELINLIKSNASQNEATLVNNNHIVNPDDDDTYYVVDLSKLDGLTLYGSSGENDIYVVNNVTHQVYYPAGIYVDDVMYYTNDADEFLNKFYVGSDSDRDGIVDTSVEGDTGTIDLTQQGTITLTFHSYTDGELITDGKGVITAYQIGNIAVDGESITITYTDDFETLDEKYISMITEGDNTAAEEIEQYITEKGINGTTASIGTDGIVSFTNLTSGVYLLSQTKQSNGYATCCPIIVSIPYWNDTEWVYDIEKDLYLTEGDKDTEGPIIVASTTQTTRKITIEVTATDEGSGVSSEAGYKYYIGETESELETATAQTLSTNTIEYDKLTQNTTYYIKIQTEDNMGNKSTKIITAKTELIPAAKEAIERTIIWNASTDPEKATATVSLDTEYTDFDILYSTDGTTWEDYDDEIDVTNGESIYICLTDGYQNGEEYKLEVLDKTGPTVTVARGDTTSSTIEVSVTARDTGAGMPDDVTYNYYIKTSDDKEYTLVAENEESATYKFTGLNAETEYNIKVTTTDLIGNEGEGTVDATTQEFTYIEGNITFSDVTWKDGYASVTIKNNTENDMEYKVFAEGETVDLTDGWTLASSKEEELTGRLNKDYIVARLTDGTNTTGYATLTITDKVAPTISVDVTTGDTTVDYEDWTKDWTNKDITLTVDAEDNESGLAEKAYSFDRGKTWQAENTATYEENTSGIVIQVKDKAENITTYDTINITNIDKTGPALSLDASATTNTITVEITSYADAGVGMEDTPTFTYYISDTYDGLATAEGVESQEKTKEYTNISQNATYYIKVIAEDKLGNTSETYTQVTTGSLDADLSTLTISEAQWESKAASVTITNKSGYYMEYQVVSKDETYDSETGWSEQISDEETPVTGLKSRDTVYARLTDGSNTSATVIREIKDETDPDVNVTVTTGDTTVDYEDWTKDWTNEDITLTIEATDNESGLQEKAYSFDGGKTWQEENTATYEENTSGIVIQVRDEAGNITTYDTIDITNIDKTGPSIILSTSGTTTSQTTVNVTASDSDGVGMPTTPTYTYSIKKENGTYTVEATDVQSATYTFEGLTAGVTYTIKVETQDALGNTNSNEIEVTTTKLLYYTGDISFTNAIWSNGIATVTQTAETDNALKYTMQYQISENGSAIDVDGEWTDVDGTSIDIGKLKDGYVIYARLTDGVNVTTGYATCNINNPAEKTYTESELASDTTRTSYDILAISASENEFRVQIEEEQSDASLYTYYYKNINDDEYTLISTCTYADDPAVITNIKEGVTYKIKVLVIDSSGNVTRCENTATMIAEEEIETGTTDDDTNRTYIDDSKEIEVRTTAGTGSAGDGTTETAKAGYTVSVPATFSISTNSGETTQDEGVVLTDSESNEYVWIPVNDAIYDGITSMPTGTSTASRTYKPMAVAQTSSTYQSIIYAYNGTISYRNTSSTGIGSTGYREPDIVTGSSLYDAEEQYYSGVLGFSSSTELAEYMQSSFDNMITAVDTYGGYYVGRYETTSEESNGNIVVGSKADSTVMSTVNWYKMYLYQDSNKYETNPYYNVASVTSSMISGTEWDTMLNWILTGDDASGVTTRIGSQKNAQSKTKQDSEDVMNNIYDLSSNVYEWTQEASGTYYRVYRGGSYDSTTLYNASSRGTVVPADQGPVFGSRLSLYVQSVSDVTGPSVKIDEVTSTSNTITVSVTATDKETGVISYKYYISTDGDEWNLDGETTSGTYTYSKLKQDTTYYIKVVAIDGSGNEGEDSVEKTTAKLGDVAETGITRIQKYGPDESGIVELELDEEYSNSGYYIEYVVIAEDGTFDTDTAKWTTGETTVTISGLSNGEYIYATIYDGINRSSDYFVEQIEGLEEYAYIDSSGNTYIETDDGGYQCSDGNTYTQGEFEQLTTTYNTTIEYTDSENTATIPAGFKVGITSSVNVINDGLVIQDEDENQFVWVPVDVAVETTTSTTSTEKAIARYQTDSTKYYEGILYSFSGTTSTKRSSKAILGGTSSTFREPSLVTAGADYTWNVASNSAKGTSYDTLSDYYKYMSFGTSSTVDAFDSYTEFGQYMNEQYTNMVKSVDTYGGFYVGRYETSVTSTGQTGVVKSQIDKTLTANINWYKYYYFQDSNLDSYNPYYGSSSVTSSMIWGSQWDAILNWMLEDEKTSSFPTSITGNHTGALANTGTYTSDLAKNIFDLSSNSGEHTQTAYSTSYRVIRGGYAVTTNDNYCYSASNYNTQWEVPTNSYVYSQIGTSTSPKGAYLVTSRMALYIKSTDDTTSPEVTVESTDKGTNNIEVSVDATDSESGISKYKYSISYYDFEATSFDEDKVLKTEEGYGSSHTFSGLLQNQVYYIRIEVINNAGLSTTVYTGAVKTEPLEVEDGAIIQDKTYGKDGSGTVYYVINDETDYENEGYVIQYVVNPTSDFDETDDDAWTTGDTVTGLYVGDIIYVRLYDGVNYNTGEYMTTEISELETFSETYTETTIYEDYDTISNEDGTETQELVGTAYIPAGFKVATSSITKKIANGLVIEDENGNQYVWIPVSQAVETSADKTTTSTVKAMARYQSGSTEYYEGIAYNFSGTTSTKQTTANRVGSSSSYREPSLVTNSTANYSWVYNAGSGYDAAYYTTIAAGISRVTSVTEWGEYMNDEYTAMIESVEKYGGFYVGRYETSLYTEAGKNSTDGTVVKSISGATPMASVNWYKMYLVSDSNYASNPNYGSSSVVSSMIWGSQWDAMLNYILTGTDAEDVTAVTGNHTGSRKTTGQFGSDIMNNIFDLSANVGEWTQEAYSTSNRAFRGGNWDTSDASSSEHRNLDTQPTRTAEEIGSRLSLYLQ